MTTWPIGIRVRSSDFRARSGFLEISSGTQTSVMMRVVDLYSKVVFTYMYTILVILPDDHYFEYAYDRIPGVHEEIDRERFFHTDSFHSSIVSIWRQSKMIGP